MLTGEIRNKVEALKQGILSLVQILLALCLVL